jgi:hypothetical protein
MTMKKAIRAFWLGAMAVLMLAPGAFAQNTVTLTGVQGSSWDGIYMSPYYATVSGVSNTPVVCDDFGDDSYVGRTWNANITSFSSLSSGGGGLAGTAWGNVTTTTYKMYEEAAWLTEEILSQTPSSTLLIDYSFADWAVMDAPVVLSWLQAAGDINVCNAIFGTGNNCTSDNVTGGLLWTAQNNTYTAGEFSNVVIISPDVSLTSNTVCTPGTGNCPAQEFMEVVPEGGAAFAYLFLAGLCCFGAIYARSRRQHAGMETA